MTANEPLADRIPPGQLLTQRFPVLHYGPIPRFDPATWTFRIWGEVEDPVLLTWEDFQSLPRTSLVMDIHCVTTWSKLDTAWEGVTLKTLQEQGLLKLKPEAKYVLQHAEHGFTVNLPLDVAMQENFLLATHYDDKPITPEHGAPLRGVCGAIPGREDLKDVYLWKGAKWLRGLEFMRQDRLGFWERAGYHNEADIWLEQRREGDQGFPRFR
jgi:DMSO/TMAO reductase YedYZ molybdopterin-dependent catalytic subunit